MSTSLTLCLFKTTMVNRETGSLWDNFVNSKMLATLIAADYPHMEFFLAYIRHRIRYNLPSLGRNNDGWDTFID